MLIKPRKFKAMLVPVEEISEETIQKMHSLFTDYYENADYETFKLDLSAKTASFLWHERGSGRLIAFANIKMMKLPYKKGKVHVFFCGDTVLHRKYWNRNVAGNSPMAGTIYWFLLRNLIRHPFNFYWFMLSMSFRTYLVIANNLVYYYPHHERTERDDPMTRKLREICHMVADHMYGDKFDTKTGLVDFGLRDQNQTIKDNVAPVTPEMLKKYPKIRFYESLNPDNHKGIEMACIGKIDIDSAIYFCTKFIRRTLSGLKNRSKITVLPTKYRVKGDKGREDIAA